MPVKIFNVSRADSWFLGEAKVLRISIVNEAGQPVNLLNYTLRYRLIDRSTGTAVATRTSAAGQITLDSEGGGTNNVAVIDMPKATTDALSAGMYRHQLDRDAGNEGVLMQGTVALMDGYGWS